MLTNDVLEKMGGVPFNNMGRRYHGSANDKLLNKAVQRIVDPTYGRAKQMAKQYETSGKIAVPLVIIHTNDHVTPFWHQEKYDSKIHPKSDLLCRIDVETYGHCTISVNDIVEAFACLADKLGLPVVSEFPQQ